MSNRSGTTYSAPTDADRRPVGLGASTSDGITPLPLEIDPATGALLVEPVSGSFALPNSIVNGQQTVTASAVALPNKHLTQGVILEALSTNTVSIFVGGSGVTTSTGIEIQPGGAVSAAVNNLDIIYVVCASTSPVITWLGS